MAMPGQQNRLSDAPRFQLWPHQRSARVSLLLLMVFAGLQALLLASTVPPWWAPDEDYHWGYINYLDERGSLPDPSKPFYAADWNKAIVAMNHNQFGMAPATVTALQGDPHAATKQLGRLPASARLPNGAPTRPVVHAPLYHSIAALVVKPFAGESVFTRLWIARAVNVFWALLIVFAAWLLAAQVFSRDGPRLFVAGLTAVQPMIAYATGTLTNDAPLIAFFTLTIAALCFMLKHPPDASQGRRLGLFAGLALLTKTSALALVPLTLAVFAIQWRRRPDQRATLGRSFAWAAGIPLVMAGWFYVFLIVKYHTLLGNVGTLNGPSQGAPQSILHLPQLTIDWLKMTYKTYWSHYLYWEGASGSTVFYVPMLLGCTAIAGFASWLWRSLRSGGPRGAVFTQAVFLGCAVLLIMAPFLGVDLMRGLSGNGFMVNGGRFLLPAYPAAAVLFVIGIRELLRVRVQRWAFAALSLVAAWQGLWMWKIKTLDRYFGGAGVTSFKQELYRASFFRPEWITQNSLLVLIALMLLAGALAWLAGVRAAGVRPRGRSPVRSAFIARRPAAQPERAG